MTMSESELQALVVASNEHLLRFLESDLALGNTFLDIAQTEFGRGYREHGTRSMQHAAEAVSMVNKFLNRIPDSNNRDRLKALSTDLERRIAEVEGTFREGAGAI